MKILALLLMALGILGLIYGGIGFNRQKTVFHMGGMTATATEHKTLPIAPVLSALVLIGGVALLVVDKRRA